MKASVEDLSRINFVFVVRQAGHFFSVIGDLKLKNSLLATATRTAEAMEDFKGNCDSLKFLHVEHTQHITIILRNFLSLMNILWHSCWDIYILNPLIMYSTSCG